MHCMDRRLLRIIALVAMPALWWSALSCAAPREYSYLDASSVMIAKQKALAGDTCVVPAVRGLVRDAEELLGRTFPVVTEKRMLPPGGDPHDYYSLSPYWWPDSTKADGLPYVRRDGRVNPEREQITDRANLRRVYAAVETFSLAYAFTDDERYAGAAMNLLRRWFLDPATRMNPGLTYAQIVRGNTKPRGAGIIEGRGMIILSSALELLVRSPQCKPEDRKGLLDWFRSYLQWLNESPQGKKEIDASNNHGSWYDAQRATIARALGDTATVCRVVNGAFSLRIASQIEPDGRMPRELQRTRALHYSTFNLMALFALATVAEKVNVDLWTKTTPDGRGIRKALDWLLPYATGTVPWPYEQISEYEPDFLYELLLRASIVYRDESYRRQAEKLRGIDTRTHRGILLHQTSP
jgi:hypothetical protein